MKYYIPGYILSLPHTLFGLLLMLWYRPTKVRWNNGTIECISEHIIPQGIDRTGDGDVDDPEDFRTGAQTHGIIIFYADEYQRLRPDLVAHERTHVWQGMLFGPLYPLTYGVFFLGLLVIMRNIVRAYRAIPWEQWARKVGERYR